MNRTHKDTFIIGLALFSMFFGAGNVIFPPYLGLGSGAQWILGFSCYYAADIGLALLTLFAILHAGSPEKVLCRLGHIPSAALMFCIVLCIGPLLAIPRTAATTYELALAPLVSGISPAMFSLFFFFIILMLCLRQSAVLDIVGKVLTPLLLAGLLLLIAKGILDPIGAISDNVLWEHVAATGIEAGYQTMDVLAAMLFGMIVFNDIDSKGYSTASARFRIIAGASLAAATALLIIYLGLTYLGATTSDILDLSISRTALVLNIVRTLMGQRGLFLFAAIVTLACVTTAAALTSAAALYFSRLLGGKPQYPHAVIILCTFSAVIASFDLEQIVSLSLPLLNVVYPPTLVLILLSFFNCHIKNDWVFRLSALGALITSLLTVAADFGAPLLGIDRLPLANLGFPWILPAVLLGLLGACIPTHPLH